ncbi:MAG: ribonuclease H [Candidatus Vogelbacteria bacterium CG10_big_fil_rev_8_21_14_0_10_45_14]|uniref:Ribonuclease H n=1 Tax=Candidatus Vogelbacteria bacterium CG10_big_fil_rev_8_21_14_0_10_45_14 TaxID=1975042 RepID=A0A2H0RJN5_9BACT|nr:MAG: ribonuclease H [Candidatus Vogelbacteria bacterium CG10_big_fil_rev_8_21_14_0_10_45_14]
MQKIIIYTDGASRNNPGEAGAGAYITDSEGRMLKECRKYLGIATNNFAEYEAIVLGLTEAKKMLGEKKAKEAEVEVRMDSELAQRQLTGVYQVKEETLWPQWMRIWNLRVKYFPKIKFTHIPREKNKEADRLSNEAIDRRVM